MAFQGKKISVEEHERIVELKDKGMPIQQIATTIRRSKNAIYWSLKKNGVKLSDKKVQPPPKVKWVMPEEVIYADLGPDILFNYKDYPAY